MDSMARFHITYIDTPLGSSVKTLQRGLTEEENSMTAGSTIQCPGGSDCIREGGGIHTDRPLALLPGPSHGAVPPRPPGLNGSFLVGCFCPEFGHSNTMCDLPVTSQLPSSILAPPLLVHLSVSISPGLAASLIPCTPQVSLTLNVNTKQS